MSALNWGIGFVLRFITLIAGSLSDYIPGAASTGDSNSPRWARLGIETILPIISQPKVLEGTATSIDLQELMTLRIPTSTASISITFKYLRRHCSVTDVLDMRLETIRSCDGEMED